MDQFLNIISTFPTVIYSILMVVIILYWFIASLGLLEIDMLDADIPDAHTGIHVHSDGLHEVTDGIEGLAGVLLKLGLNGVPITVVITFLVMFGWIISYFAALLISPLLGSSIIQILVGIPIFIAAFALALPCTAVVIRPMRTLFDKSQTKTTQSLIGKIGTIRSTKVNATFGEIEINDEGAHLILRIRASEPNDFKKGDRVALLEYTEADNSYQVVAESEFY
ncbi:MAG: DUF1449 family protein [Methylococcales bacterium]|jgi:uncharacterized membrane protein (DUF485 family)|nr:DUF1449 family protein [Methylococcales bacterium]